MKKLMIAAALMALSASSYAEQWQILGTRPMGMGGAFVGVAQGPIAQYWNPGGMVKSEANVSGMEIPVGVTAEFTGNILENASQIGDMADKFAALDTAQRTSGAGGTTNADQMAAFVKTLSLMGRMNEPGKGALAEVAGGVNFKFSKLALSINNFTSMGLNPWIDTVNVGLSSYGSLPGVNLSGAPAPSGAAQTAAASQIAGAIGAGSLYSSLETLICGSAACLTSWGITTQGQLADALVGMAAQSGLSDSQITEAAATFAEYTPGAAPIIQAAAAGNSYTNNQSALTVVGASFMEVTAGYAWSKDNWLKGLSIGGNLKMINGRTAYSSFRFLAESDTMEAFSLENSQSSWKPGIDVGLLWKVRQKYEKFPLDPKVGLVIRNINSPKFDMPEGVDGTYQLKRQARLGFALNPAKFWTLALDMDLTKNKTPVRGFDSRQLCMGTEINLVNRKAFNIPLRAGLMKNMAEKDSKMAYTLGTGLNLLFMHFDVSGVVSSDRTEIDGDEYPTKVGVAASFGLLF